MYFVRDSNYEVTLVESKEQAKMLFDECVDDENNEAMKNGEYSYDADATIWGKVIEKVELDDNGLSVCKV